MEQHITGFEKIDKAETLVNFSMYKNCDWLNPPSTPQLTDYSVHLWLMSFDVLLPQVGSLDHLLSVDERERAERFVFGSDRNRFILRRAVLRLILSLYVSIPPDELEFCYGPYGKPALIFEQGRGEIGFNLSHSKDLVLYAVTRNARVGVDVEYMSSFLETKLIVEHVFSLSERSRWLNLSEDQQQDAFFHYWTRREAFAKAGGEGLAISPERFDVLNELTELDDSKAAQKVIDKDLTWSFYELSPMPGYSASLFVEGNDRQLHFWQWVNNNSLVGDFNLQEFTK